MWIMCTLWVCYSSACTSVSYLSKSRSGCNCSLEVTACKLSCHTFHNTKQVGSTVPMPLDPYKTCWDPAGRSCSSSSDLCFTSFRLTDKNLVNKNQWPSGLEIPWAMDFVSKISGASQTFLYRMASLPLYFSSNASKYSPAILRPQILSKHWEQMRHRITWNGTCDNDCPISFWHEHPTLLDETSSHNFILITQVWNDNWWQQDPQTHWNLNRACTLPSLCGLRRV